MATMVRKPWQNVSLANDGLAIGPVLVLSKITE
jgi:hypothetical protein